MSHVLDITTGGQPTFRVGVIFFCLNDHAPFMQAETTEASQSLHSHVIDVRDVPAGVSLGHTGALAVAAEVSNFFFIFYFTAANPFNGHHAIHTLFTLGEC